MRRTTLTLALLLVCGCGAATGSGGPSSQPTPSPVALSCNASGAASPSWPAPPAASATAPAIASAVADGDTLKLSFVSGTSQYEVVPVGSAHFTVDPSGRTVDLTGTSGVKIVLRGFRGDTSNYGGPARLTATGPLLLEIGAIGDVEGVVSFGAGVSKAACANVTAGSSTLTFKFIPAP